MRRPNGEWFVQIAPQIEFRHMAVSDAVSADIRRRVIHLERLFDRIVACRVVIEAPHRHQHQGRLFRVSVELDVPGRRIVVNRAGPHDQAHEDAHVAIRDAFAAAERQLQDHARLRRVEVKTHDGTPTEPGDLT